MKPKNKRLLPVLAIGVLALGATLTPSGVAGATGNPSALDRGDLTQACHLQYGAGWSARLFGNTAYSWKCTRLWSSEKRDVDVNRYCQAVWGVYAATPVANNPYSWKCQGY